MRRAFSIAVAAIALASSACSGHYLNAMQPVHALAHDGRSNEAVQRLSEQTDGTGWDALLVMLDRGALLHRAGRWAESAEALNKAIEIADQRETVSVGQELFGQVPFRMANYEKQALHAMQAINYLMLGQTDEAVVEARLTDLRQRKLEAETDVSRDSEHFITGSSVDEQQRAFFEQLVFGRYVSGLARERAGDLDGAFIDYYRALTLMRASPVDARIELGQLLPKLLALAEKLERPELKELRAWYPTVVASSAPKGEGEVVVLLELGFAPLAEIVQRQVDMGGGSQMAQGTIELHPVPRAELPIHVVASRPVAPDVVSSVEELAMRRGYRGILVDRERKGTVGVNTVLFFTYFLVPPLAGALLIRRAWELAMRDTQSWALLPAELAVARITLPAGRQRLKVPTLHGLVEREVDVKPGGVTVLVAEGP